jgi:hypothetical protein
MDIADLVLEDHDTVVVVENYYTSSGHGYWRASERCVDPDYSHLFVTCGKRIRQSVVGLREVVNGLSQDDTRLRDEFLGLIKEPVIQDQQGTESVE